MIERVVTSVVRTLSMCTCDRTCGDQCGQNTVYVHVIERVVYMNSVQLNEGDDCEDGKSENEEEEEEEQTTAKACVQCIYIHVYMLHRGKYNNCVLLDP